MGREVLMAERNSVLRIDADAVRKIGGYIEEHGTNIRDLAARIPDLIEFTPQHFGDNPVYASTMQEFINNIHGLAHHVHSQGVTAADIGSRISNAAKEFQALDDGFPQ